MIEEIYRKILHNEEDELTGDFFGTIKYIPFQEGLGKILISNLENDKANIIKKLDKPKYYFWNKDDNNNRKFRKAKDNTEPDLLIVDEKNRIVILIEVKYNSGPSDSEEITQVEREENFLNENFIKEDKYETIFIYIAKDELCNVIKQRYNKDKIIIISWSNILETINRIRNEEKNKEYIKEIFEDIGKLLEVKNFEQFKGFSNNIREVNKLYYEFEKEEDKNERKCK